MNPLLKRSDMDRESKGITQFYLPPTHEPYLDRLVYRTTVKKLTNITMSSLANPNLNPRVNSGLAQLA